MPAPATTAPDERRLVARARAGDHEAFLQLVRAHDDGLRAVAYRLLGDADAMDDVLQAALVKAFRSLGSFGGRSSAATWLYRIVVNTCLDELRRRGTRPQAAGGLDELPGAHADHADDVARRLDLAAALAALPAEVRAAVLLVDGQGLDYRDAARALGTRAGTVASRLHRGRAALRLALANPEEGS